MVSVPSSDYKSSLSCVGKLEDIHRKAKELKFSQDILNTV